MKAKFKRAKDVKVGVIGYGPSFNMGNGHLKEMQNAGMTPVAVAEPNAERRKVAAAEFPGIETYASAATMLKKSKVNLLALITPHNTHTKLALQCLNAGRHVVSEKPLAITTEQCDAMINAARKNKVMLSTYHNRHWDGCIVTAMKQIKKQKVIGDVFRVDAHMGGYGRPGDSWRGSKSISGGILYDWGVHLLEWCLQVIDSEIVEVTGFARNGFWAKETMWKKDTNEDDASSVVRFKNGIRLVFGLSNLESNPKPGVAEFTGTHGSYIMDHGTYSIVKHVNGEKVVTSGKNVANDWGKYYKEVANHLVKGTPLTISAEWARRPIHILDLTCKSAKQGKALKAKHK